MAEGRGEPTGEAMGEVTGYPNGTFNWVDLGTPDVAGAKAFYSHLFGWTLVDVPAGGSRTYTVAQLQDMDVAAIHQHAEGEGEGKGAEWGSSISVDHVDRTASKARHLGATVLREPEDVMEAGRMALVRDPAGAVVSLWQPGTHMGARLVNEVGTWGWNELVTTELDAAKAFYGDLFGWTAEDVPAGIPRTSFSMGDLLIGGAHAPTPQEGDGSRWTVSFLVADAHDSAGRVGQLGGRVLLPPTDIPIGTFSIVSDAAGAAFTIAAVPGGAFRGLDGS